MIKKILNIQFIKFILVGGLNTLFGYLVFSLYIYLSDLPTLSVILANITGVVFNFRTYGKLVFKSTDNSRIFRFCAAYTLIIITQLSLLKFLNVLGINNPYMAGAILTPPVALMSFFLLRTFVFPSEVPYKTS